MRRRTSEKEVERERDREKRREKVIILLRPELVLFDGVFLQVALSLSLSLSFSPFVFVADNVASGAGPGVLRGMRRYMMLVPLESGYTF